MIYMQAKIANLMLLRKNNLIITSSSNNTFERLKSNFFLGGVKLLFLLHSKFKPMVNFDKYIKIPFHEIIQDKNKCGMPQRDGGADAAHRERRGRSGRLERPAIRGRGDSD